MKFDFDGFLISEGSEMYQNRNSEPLKLQKKMYGILELVTPKIDFM